MMFRLVCFLALAIGLYTLPSYMHLSAWKVSHLGEGQVLCVQPSTARCPVFGLPSEAPWLDLQCVGRAQDQAQLETPQRHAFGGSAC